jgi:cytoskeletal protein RodZ
MDPIEKRELKRKARLRLAAQRRRAGLLRGRVVALSLICFALLWGIVFVQMATGNDPVLSAKEGSRARVTASARRRPSAARHRERKREAEAESEPAELEAVPELEVATPESEEAATEVEEIEPEFEAEPLVTSQS